MLQHSPWVLVAALLLAWAAGVTLGWYVGRWRAQSIVHDLAGMVGGKVDWMVRLPDGSGAATMSMPLPKDHWLLKDGYNDPPMPWRMGLNNPDRGIAESRFEAVARYAIRASTMNGAVIDFDPDAMVRNFVVGAIGYYTYDGQSHADETFEELQPTVDVRNVRNEVQVPLHRGPEDPQGTGSSKGQRPSFFRGGIPPGGQDDSTQGSSSSEDSAGKGQGTGPIRRT